MSHDADLLNLRLHTIDAGSFTMGEVDGRDSDERPVHTVRISKSFRIAECPVTNAQYEMFDPDHRRFRGKEGISSGDDEAVTYVTWHDAVDFCRWLSQRHGLPYRLPTEAEWEYACRAGTTTEYWPGDTLPEAFHRNQPVEGDWAVEGIRADDDLREKKGRVPVDLTVGRTPPNPWGLRDVHGIVEEWCLDWYGPYSSGEEVDPTGPIDGITKVTRGGSHSNYTVYLRSAERHAALPEDRHWIIGFRVVQAETPKGDTRPPVLLSFDDPSVETRKDAWGRTFREPFFAEPVPFVVPDCEDSDHDWLHHHHNPSITWCENGDLLACWFNTRSEVGREMRVLSSRLRRGQHEWDTARVFFNVADRNMTGSSLFHDRSGKLYYFGAISESSHHRDQCLVMAVSTDSGRSWSMPKIISSTEDRHAYKPLDSVFVARDGRLVVAMDYAPIGFEANACGSGVFLSTDGGETWDDRISGKERPDIVAGGTGPLIAGFHTAIVQRADGSLLAFGRTNPENGLVNIEGRMPQSISNDMGHIWRYSPSPFPPIGGGQRLAVLRLAEGPILFVSFTDRYPAENEGMVFQLRRDSVAQGVTTFRGRGMFAALSYDDGETWPVRRLLTTGGLSRQMDGGGNTGGFTMDDTHAEPRGYLAITQTPDRVIHLLSSRYHYRFNLSWIEQNGR